jgi:mannose-1-phosphate guanylyltransferase
MKAFLLAAGNGTRLKPLTDTTPKCLLPIRGIPLLSIWLQFCKRSGIHEVLINTHAHRDTVRQYVAGTDHGVRVKIFEEPTLLGSAGTLAANREWVAGEKLFWVLYADVLTNVRLQRLLECHTARQAAATIAVCRVPDPSRCGVVNLDVNGVVQEFIEKPAKPASNLAFTGVLLATPLVLDAIPDRRPADIGFDVLPRLTGRMSACETDDYLQDIGTLENYENAQMSWPGLTVEASCPAQ